MSKKAAVFDLDGTLRRWNHFHRMLQACVEWNLLPSVILIEPNKRLKAYKNRIPGATFRLFTDSLIEAVSVGNRFRGVRVDDMTRVCEHLAEQSDMETHVFCEELNRIAIGEGYTPIILTGSPTVAVKPFARQRGIDLCFGTEFVTDTAGKFYTGDIMDTVVQHKGEFLRKLAAKYNLDLAHSVAIGDSEGDISMLGEVGFPIAFNPNLELMESCREHRTPCVVEKKIVHSYAWSERGGLAKASETSLSDILPFDIAEPLMLRLRELGMHA